MLRQKGIFRCVRVLIQPFTNVHFLMSYNNNKNNNNSSILHYSTNQYVRILQRCSIQCRVTFKQLIVKHKFDVVVVVTEQ